MGVHYNPKIVTEGLTLYIDPANIKSYTGSGNAVTDLSRSSLITGIELNDGWSYSTNNGGTFVFDGVNGKANVVGNAVSQTIITWAMLTNTAIVQASIYGPNDNGDDNCLGFNSGTPWLFTCEAADVNNASLYGAAPVSNGTWVQLAATISGNTAALYVNGALVNSAVYAYTIAPWNTRPKIGSRGNGVQMFFKGSIGPVFTYSSTFSATQIKQNFDALRGRFGI